MDRGSAQRAPNSKSFLLSKSRNSFIGLVENGQFKLAAPAFLAVTSSGFVEAVLKAQAASLRSLPMKKVMCYVSPSEDLSKSDANEPRLYCCYSWVISILSSQICFWSLILPSQ